MEPRCAEWHDTEAVKAFEFEENEIKEIEAILEANAKTISPFNAEKLERNAVKNWNLFYKRNNENFFKDRIWLLKEFVELFSCSKDSIALENTEMPLLIDVGCGVGNGLIPILKKNIRMQAIAVDCSVRAIEMLMRRWRGVIEGLENMSKSTMDTNINKEEEAICVATKIHKRGCREYLDLDVEISKLRENQLLLASPFDVTQGDLSSLVMTAVSGCANQTLPARRLCNFALLLFVLSAVNPNYHLHIALEIKKVLAYGGLIFFRDYAVYDLAQIRFAKTKEKISQNFYARYDGTYAYFFTQDELRELFCHRAGFEEVENKMHCRIFKNRKTNLEMKRVWIQAKFKRV